jgi:predicted XRE-type DNA-binding protein
MVKLRVKAAEAHYLERHGKGVAMVREDTTVSPGSDNVFADLGFENPREELLKAKLVREIRAIIKRRELTQAEAADLMGVKQPDVSAIVVGRTGKFSLDRLVRCLDRLDYEVDVVVRHKRGARSKETAV